MGNKFQRKFDAFYNHYVPLYENFKRYGEVTLDVDLSDEEEIKEIFLKSQNIAEFRRNMETYWLENYQVTIQHFTDIKNAYSYSGKIVDSSYIQSAIITNYPYVVSHNIYDYLWTHSYAYEYDKGLALVEIEGTYYLIDVCRSDDSHHITIRREKFDHNSIIHAIPTT